MAIIKATIYLTTLQLSFKGEIIMEGRDQRVLEVESLIAQIQGVISNRLVCQDGEIVEIHVLANNNRTPKQLVRDIESAVMVKLGLELDHKKISVVQLEPGMPLPLDENFRFQFKAISYSSENGTAAIMITIKSGDDLYTATISGPKTGQNRLRLTASATLSAVEKYLKIEETFIVGDIQRINLCGQEIIVSAIYMRSKDREEMLLGTAINKGDDLEATVRASLDAINRRLSVLTEN